MKQFIPLILLLAAGCTSTISANPVQDITSTQTSPLASFGTTIQTDLQSAEYNLDQAVLVGALDPTDPAPKCLHEALTAIGIEPGMPGAPSFTPKNDGLASLGAIAYIRAQQLKKAQGGISLPTDCKTLIGQIVLDGAAAGKNILPGGSILPSIQ